MELENFENLVDLAVAHEQSLLLNQLSKNTADCPDIDSETILALAQKDFGGAIPESFDFVREGLNWNAKSAGKSKVCDFQDSWMGEGVPLRSMRRFWGLRSLWMMRREWQKLIPLMSWNMISLTWWRVIVPLFAVMNLFRSC